MESGLRPQEAAFEASLPSLPDAALVPELHRVLARASSLSHYRGSPALALLKQEVAKELNTRGLLADALPLFEQGLAELSATLGPEHLETAGATLQLASCLANVGEMAAAQPHATRALALLTRHLGADHELPLEAAVVLADVRSELGNLDGADDLLRQAQATLARLAVRAGLAGNGPPPGLEMFWSTATLTQAVVLKKRLRLDAAERLLRDALAAWTGAQASRPRTNLLFELANVLRRQGNLQGAEQVYREMLPEMEKEADPNYGIVCQNLGLLLQGRGLVTEARKFMDLARRRQQESFGALHMNSAKCVVARASLDSRLRTCAGCGPLAEDVVMKVCSGCKAARYCGAACQKLHWKAHKADCKRIKAENESIAAGSGSAGPSTAGSSAQLSG